MLEGASLGPDMTDEDRALTVSISTGHDGRCVYLKTRTYSTSMTVASFNTISQAIWSICQEEVHRKWDRGFDLATSFL